MLKRHAFKMKLKPGCMAEYKKRHDEIWPELAALIRGNGVSDYAIFLDEETDILFACQKIAGSGGSQDLGGTEIVKRWWAYMADLMETNPDSSPLSVPLKEVFYLE
jgi:L-rhamnose mutarotase